MDLLLALRRHRTGGLWLWLHRGLRRGLCLRGQGQLQLEGDALPELDGFDHLRVVAQTTVSVGCC